jgi:SAM-dependent methyltransferase
VTSRRSWKGFRLSETLKKLRWSIKRRGVLGSVQVLLQRDLGRRREREPVHPFDAKYGTDTGGLIGGGSLGAGHAHDAYITAYAGMPPSRFEATLVRWLAEPPVEPLEAYSFVDVGCGKGRVVFLAARRPFARVVGVELDPGLMRTARENLDRWQQSGEAVAPVEIVGGDATEYKLPPSPCLLYLANSFGAPVLQRLLEELEKRAEAGGGSVDLIYQNPEHRDVFKRFPAWRLLWDEEFALSEEDTEFEPVYGSGDRCLGWRR